MSHSAHPYGYRLVNLRDWKSRWFARDKASYRDFLKSDILLREYLETQLKGKYVANIEFERGTKKMRVVIHSSRPGLIIGKGGESITKLREATARFIRKKNLNCPSDVHFDIVEIAQPEGNAEIVAQMIEGSLRRRMPFRRVMKQMIEKVMQQRGVKGCRIQLSGTVGGSATMARKEQVKRGPIPLQFIRADIDYAERPAKGLGVGIKVWINYGDSLEKREEVKVAPRGRGRGRDNRGPRGRRPGNGGNRRNFNRN